MTTFDADASEFLRNAFRQKQIRHPAFSVQRFASRSGLSKSMASMVLNGKRRLSHDRVAPVLAALNRPHEERYLRVLMDFEIVYTSEAKAAIANLLPVMRTPPSNV